MKSINKNYRTIRLLLRIYQVDNFSTTIYLLRKREHKFITKLIKKVPNIYTYIYIYIYLQRETERCYDI